MAKKEKLQKCDFCGVESPDISNEVFMSEESVVRHYEICPVCLVEVYKRIVNLFMEEDEYKVNGIINEVMDEMYCDVIHMNKESDVEITEDNATIYELKRK